MPRFEGDPWVINKSKSNKRQSANILDPKVFGYGETPRYERQKPEVFTTRGTKDTIIIEDGNGLTTIRINPKGSTDKQRPGKSWETRKPFEMEEGEEKGKQRIKEWLDDTKTVLPEDDDYQKPAFTSRSRTMPVDSAPQENFSPIRSRTMPVDSAWNGEAYPRTYDRVTPSRDKTRGKHERDGVPSDGYERIERPGPSSEEIDRRAKNNYRIEVQRWYADSRAHAYAGNSPRAKWSELTTLRKQELRSIAERQLLSERTLDNVQPSKVPVHDSKSFNQSQARNFDQTEIPLHPKREEIKRRSSVYDKMPNPSTDKSRKNREFEVDSGQKQEIREPSFLEISDKAREMYNQAIENEFINNREYYEYQKSLGSLPVAWEHLDPRIQKDYRDDAFQDILAKRKRNASKFQKSTHEQPRHNHKDASVEEPEEVRRPPVTTRDNPKRRNSMSSPYTPSRENTLRSREAREPFIATPEPNDPFLQQMEAEIKRNAAKPKKSTYEQPRRSREDTDPNAYVEEPEEVLKPPRSSNNHRSQRSSSMSRTEAPRREEKFRETPITTKKQSTREYSQPMAAERQSRRTSRDTYTTKEDDRRPPLSGRKHRPQRSHSMSRADTTRPKENLDAQPINIQEQNTLVYSHKVNRDNEDHQPMKTEKQLLRDKFLKAAEEDWLASGAYGKNYKELERINAKIKKIEWQDFEPNKRKSEYDRIMNAYAARYNNKPIIAWAVD